MMNHSTRELSGQWLLTKISGTEGFTRYQLLGYTSKTVIADLYNWNAAAGSSVDLNVEIKDEDFTDTTSTYNLQYTVFVPESASTYYSNFRISGPPENIGLPHFSSRNAFAVRVDAGGAELDFTSELVASINTDVDDHSLTMGRMGTGEYVSEIIVPVLDIEAQNDTGLDGNVTAYLLNIKANPPSVSLVDFKLEKNIDNSTVEIAKGSIKAEFAMLLSAQLGKETLGMERGSKGVNEPGVYAIKQLGWGVTALLAPTKEKINELLPKHSVWIHSGHGLHAAGVLIVNHVGVGKYEPTFMSGDEITINNLQYKLVFMNTCESTDKHYKLNGDNATFTYVGEYPADQRKVWDIGTKLGAKNYIGWDTAVERLVSTKAVKIFLEKCNSGGTGAPPSINEAVEATKESLGSGTWGVYSSMLRLVNTDNARLDLAK